MKAAVLLSLGHMLNERKHTHRTPLALREAWGVWDPSAAAPRNIKIGLFWGPRPNDAPNRTDAYIPKGVELEEWIKKSRRYWSFVLHEDLLAPVPFENPTRFIGTKKGRSVLIYKDTRCSLFPSMRNAQSDFWHMRRSTLKEAPNEAGHFFAQLGGVLAVAAKPAANEELPISRLREARQAGEAMAEEALQASFWIHDPERSNLDYDFACREAGQTANDFDSADEASAFLETFFTCLASNKHWAKLAQGGEQEVFFPLLCRLEQKWTDRLTRTDAYLKIGSGNP